MTACLFCTRDADRGSITPFALIFIVTLILFVGLAVDGGAKLRAGWEAVGIAEEAARAGAGQIDRRAAYEGRVFIVDRGAAVRAAQAYLSATGRPGSVAITGPDSIRVRVTVTKPTWLLSLVGLSSVSMTATATADLVSGVERPN
ncbi:pilus assembly protein TadG-related protein [Microbispora sp. NPDC049125]|uniref:pilus assembly protein TadG-related protein n=1 Tax=Microbispora sp. NPDC049125 TaxID=3154929 RepID=UPI003466BE74